MEEKMKVLKQLLCDVETNFAKYQYKNNKSAGTRVRTSLSKMRKIAQEMRMEILEKKRSSVL